MDADLRQLGEFTKGRCLAVLGGPGARPTSNWTLRKASPWHRTATMIVADSGNSRVLRWDPQGRCRLVLGINRPDPTLGGLMAGGERRTGRAEECAADAPGNIYVADTDDYTGSEIRPRQGRAKLLGKYQQRREGLGLGDNCTTREWFGWMPPATFASRTQTRPGQKFQRRRPVLLLSGGHARQAGRWWRFPTWNAGHAAGSAAERQPRHLRLKCSEGTTDG